MALTYEPIATTTLGSTAASISFASIPSTYTDLRLIVVPTSTSSSDVDLRFNDVASGNLYSRTTLYGNGSASVSNQTSNQNQITVNVQWGLFTTFGQTIIIDVFSYTASSHKTALIQYNAENNSLGVAGRIVGLWRSTSAITKISLLNTSSTFAAGTTATLYGIKAA